MILAAGVKAERSTFLLTFLASMTSSEGRGRSSLRTGDPSCARRRTNLRVSTAVQPV